MKIVSSPTDIYRLAIAWKTTGKSVALVPTMGCLHEGHLSLIRLAKEYADRVIVSIFVNPMQFGANEDFATYPRQLQKDCERAEKEGSDTIFCPETNDMYGKTFQTTIRVTAISQGMCGLDRPGHFDGVATVVTKLFHLTLADFAVFGEKDFQQLTIIRQLVRDLNIPIEILAGLIVREVDGLAISSRNKYLSVKDRKGATCLYKSILAAKKMVRTNQGPVAAKDIIDQTKEIIGVSGAELDYAVVVDALSLKDVANVTDNSILAVAAKFDNTVRLIDNGSLTD